MHRSNGPIGPVGCKLSSANVYFKQRFAEATVSHQLITLPKDILGLPSNSQMPEVPAHPSWYNAFVLCHDLAPSHSHMPEPNMSLMTAIVITGLLKTSG